MLSIQKITELAHLMARQVIREGDHAVDATAGNGYDTIMLAEAVGPGGYVYAFDIQEQALLKTAERLKQKKMDKRVALINAGHQYLLQYVNYPVAAVMYNLGYLPGGDRQVTTKYDTTIESIRQALNLLKPGGVVTVILYPGHERGLEEKRKLVPVFQQLNPSRYAVLHGGMLNQGNDPPELVIVQKSTRDG